MTNLGFYFHERYDGGTRAGVEIANRQILERFDEGDGDFDAGLLWYIDLDVVDPSSNSAEPTSAQDFLIQHRTEIKGALSRFADRLQVGSDPGWPARYRESINGLTLALSATCVEKFRAGELATEIRTLANRWEPLVRSLEPTLLAA